MHGSDSTEGARIVNTPPCVLRRGEVVTRQQLLDICGGNKATLRKWTQAGLQPLETFTKQDLYLTDEVIEVWTRRQPRRGGES